MSQRTFHIEVLKAQGVPPALAVHIVSMVDALEAKNADLSEKLAIAVEVIRNAELGGGYSENAQKARRLLVSITT